MNLLEQLTTKYVIATTFLLSALNVAGYFALIRFGVTDVDELSKYVDVIFKTIAILVGAIWSLNRHFVQRTDALQIRVEDDVNLVVTNEDSGSIGSHPLLIYRIDVHNTGKTLIPNYQQYFQVESVVPSSEGIEYQILYRWPQAGWHSGGPIEPSSWSAINNVIMIPLNTVAVRFYLELEIGHGSKTLKS